MNSTPTLPFNENITSGEHQSFWVASTEPIIFKKLTTNISTDVLIVGGGIAGLTTAYCLLKSGQKVALVEDGYIGSGETGRTTAHLTCALDDRYYEIESLFGTEKTILAAKSHTEAIHFIEKVVRNENVDCNFKRVPGYLFLSENDTQDSLNKEFKATQNAQIPTQMLNYVPDIAREEGKYCIKFPDQAQIHISKYLQGLTDAIVKMGGSIYTETKAENISKNGATANGFEIKANHIVVATNTPVNDLVTIHTKQAAYRTYVIACKIPKNVLPYALWWDTGDQESKWVAAPYHYVRLEEFDALYDLIIVGGEDHKVGQADGDGVADDERFSNLVNWTKSRFPAAEDIVYKWSGQVMEPVDCMAFIGKNPGDENIYIITGDSGNGITHGTLGGIILNDLIINNENEYADLYSPSRISLKATTDFLQEAGNMAAQYVDWFKTSDISDAEDLQAGQGAVISDGIHKIAAYRDNENRLHQCSAICPHLGAILQWNDIEKTFDCPAHGSRFTCTGTVINGPSNANLKTSGKLDIK